MADPERPHEVRTSTSERLLQGAVQASMEQPPPRPRRKTLPNIGGEVKLGKTGLKLTKWSLYFPQEKLETAFNQDLCHRGRYHIRGSLIGICALLLGAGFLDWDSISSDYGGIPQPDGSTSPGLSAASFVLLGRVAVATPITLLVFALTWSKSWWKFAQPALCLVVLAVEVVDLQVMCQGGRTYYPSLLIVLILSTVLLRIRFIFALPLSLLLLAGLNVTPKVFDCPRMNPDFRESIYLVCAATMLLLSTYTMEYHMRKDFAHRVRLHREREKLDSMLSNILPEHICQILKDEERALAMAKTNQCIADRFDDVTILFADIVGFTTMSSKISPQELVRSLNKLFCSFDHLAVHHGLEKIKTIGDCYMVAGGLPVPTSPQNDARNVVNMAISMQKMIRGFKLDSLPDHQLRVRVGCNTGSVVAGVIGRKKFCYDLWGDAVNTASRMESHGEADRVHISESTYELLKDCQDFMFEPRGEISVKGKGKMKTYFVEQKRLSVGQNSNNQNLNNVEVSPIWSILGHTEMLVIADPHPSSSGQRSFSRIVFNGPGRASTDGVTPGHADQLLQAKRANNRTRSTTFAMGTNPLLEKTHEAHEL